MANERKTPARRSQRQTAAEKRKLEEAAAAVEAAEASAPPEEGENIGPAVVVYRQQQPNGDTTIAVAPMNGLDLLAVPALLQLGLNAINEQLGL